jgi:dienelactone hydrolase
MRKLMSAAWLAALAFNPLTAGCGDDPAGMTSNGNPAIQGIVDSGTPAPVTPVQPSVPGSSTQLDGGSVLPPAMTGTNPPNVVPSGDAGSVGTPPGDAGTVVAPADGGSAGGGGSAIIRGDEPTSASATAKGPYQVMTYTSGFPVMLYGGGTIHYPVGATPPFAAVAVCPGFVSAQSSIQSWGPFLASHGIVTLTIDTATPLDPVDSRVEELMDALASIKSENTRMESPLFNKIDPARLGVMGWSMGGGATWLAAAMNSTLKSAVSFAGHIATALNQDVTKNSVPTLLLAGQNDTLILGGGMSQPVYDQIPESTPKMVWEVSGAGHDVANSPSGTGGAIGRYGLSWQKVYLEGDMRYRKFLLEMPPSSSYFKTNVK